jgi:exosortase
MSDASDPAAKNNPSSEAEAPQGLAGLNRIPFLDFREIPASVVILGGMLAALFLGMYYFSRTYHFLWIDWLQPEYQYAFLVPVFSGYLLWRRREMLRPLPQRGTWWSLVFFSICLLLNCIGVLTYYPWFGEVSIIPGLVGILLVLGGWQALRWAWPAVFFLCFMIRLPAFLSEALSLKLQEIGTKCSVYVIQTLGIPTMAQGNVIVLRESYLEVARACSGLKMLMMFFAVCVGFVLVVKKPLWEKVVLVISAIPMAVAINVLRITAMALLHEFAFRFPNVLSKESASYFIEEIFHKYIAAVFEVGLAFLFVWAEMAIMAHLFLKPVADRSLVARRAVRGFVPQQLRHSTKKPP